MNSRKMKFEQLLSMATRDQGIVVDRRAGSTYRELEAKYGLTRERCRQICKAAGIPRKKPI